MEFQEVCAPRVAAEGPARRRGETGGHVGEGFLGCSNLFSKRLRIKEGIALKEGRAALAAVRATVGEFSGAAQRRHVWWTISQSRLRKTRREGNLWTSFNSDDDWVLLDWRHMTRSDGHRPSEIHPASSLHKVRMFEDRHQHTGENSPAGVPPSDKPRWVKSRRRCSSALVTLRAFDDSGTRVPRKKA